MRESSYVGNLECHVSCQLAPDGEVQSVGIGRLDLVVQTEVDGQSRTGVREDKWKTALRLRWKQRAALSDIGQAGQARCRLYAWGDRVTKGRRQTKCTVPVKCRQQSLANMIVDNARAAADHRLIPT